MLEKTQTNTPPKNFNSKCHTLAWDFCLEMIKLARTFKFLIVWVLVVGGYWQPFLFAPEEVAPWFKLGPVPRASVATGKVGRMNASVAPSKAAEWTLSPGRQGSPRTELLTGLPHCRSCFHLEKRHVFPPPRWGIKLSGCTFLKQEKSLPTHCWEEMVLKPLWDVQKKETYHLSVHPNV